MVDRNVEVNDDQLGFVASDELNPQKSRVLLSLALLNNDPPGQLQELFRSY
jgi:L-asparaginase